MQFLIHVNMVMLVCKGQSSKHKRATWGYNAKEKRFATSEETAYLMGLAKMFASCFVNALVSKGIAVPPENLEAIKQSLQYMRASTGMQADYLLLFQHFLQRFSYVHSQSLPAFKIFQKTTSDIVCNRARKEILPKGAKLLAMLPSNADNGGEDDIACEFVDDKNPHSPSQEIHLQTWGIPSSSSENRASHAPSSIFTVTHVTATVRVMHSHQRHYLLLACSFKNY